MFRLSVSAMVILLLFVIQTTLFDHLLIFGAKPDFMVVMVVFAAFYYPYALGAGLSFLLGYLTGLYSGVPLGIDIISKGLIHFLAFHSIRTLFLDSPLSQAIFVFSAILLEGSVVYLLVSFVGLSLGPYPDLVLISVIRGGYSALLTPALFFSMKWAAWQPHTEG